jgi:hypothetical protein
MPCFAAVGLLILIENPFNIFVYNAISKFVDTLVGFIYFYFCKILVEYS